MIQTVTGLLHEAEVENTLSHEHLVFGKPGFLGDEDNCYSREQAEGHIRAMLGLAKNHRVNLIIDATTIEWGRGPYLMRKMSEETGVHIVCATGFFKDEGDMLAHLKALSYTHNLEEYLKRYFISEITEGIGCTGVRAGVIKAAASLEEIKPLEAVILSAAAHAQEATGVPLLTHCDRGTMGREQVKLLLANGASPQKIIIGHMSSSRNLEEIEEIMDTGVLAAFDQFGIVSIPGIPDDAEKMENLLALLQKGYEDSIVLSHDCCFDRMGYVSKSKPRYPDMVYKHVLPFLRENHISDSAIRKITRDNLLKAFQ